MMPWPMRAIAAVVGPLFFSTVAESAHNVVEACLRDDWASPTHWDKVGRFDQQSEIVVDEATTRGVIEGSRELTRV